MLLHQTLAERFETSKEEEIRNDDFLSTTARQLWKSAAALDRLEEERLWRAPWLPEG